MKDIKDLLKLFPNFRPITYHVDTDNNIVPNYTYFDRLELEQMFLDKENSGKIEMELF